ncbi:hypothetical protein SDJN03_00714, partial [Cucurbita argyrosperma subsp. sororia]
MAGKGKSVEDGGGGGGCGGGGELQPGDGVVSYAYYGGEVAPECCSAIKSLISIGSTTTADRRTALRMAFPQCLESTTISEKCGATVPYKIK